jgi:Zn-dependent protease
MMPTGQGSIRLFRLAGIDLFLHWSWFLVAVYGINVRRDQYSSWVWPVLEYLALFLIVLMHEFGHALACRQVGGKADQIVLWPLGGVAYVAPPPRPGATLWSIVAGPLVNVALAPFLTLLLVVAGVWGLPKTSHNASTFIEAVWATNCIVLVFNLLPIYPLDGGQVLRSLLWYIVGRARSLMVTVYVGFVGVAVLIGWAFLDKSYWLGIIAVFILLNCWRGLMHARILARVARLPRRAGYACPDCKEAPVRGPFWRCAKCSSAFDTFETQAVCPKCGTQYPVTHCMDCGGAHAIHEWVLAPPIPATEAPQTGGTFA